MSGRTPVLYEWPPTRSNRVRWALMELGIEHESRLVDMKEGEQHSPTYRRIHPLGVVPVLETGAYTIFESVAIVLQLVDEHPEAGLAPAPGTPDRARYYQWCLFAAAEVEPALMLYFDNALKPVRYLRPPQTRRRPTMAEKGRHDFGLCADILSDHLVDRDTMVGTAFTGADIVIGHCCFMARSMDLLGAFPVLEAYFARLQERPAYRSAYGD